MAKNVVPTEQQLHRKGGKDSNRTPNNFFSNNIRQNGDNFLDRMKPDEMQRSVQKIFRDICKGKVDMSIYAPYIAHPQLLNILIDEAQSISMEANIIYTCIGNTISQLNSMGQAADELTTSTREKYRLRFMAYHTFYSQLCIFRDTMNPMVLITLQNNTSGYYNFI